jgi:hypothetical protein
MAVQSHNQTFVSIDMNASLWRDRAGRRIRSDGTALKRSTSQSGGDQKSNANARNSRFVDEASIDVRVQVRL